MPFSGDFYPTDATLSATRSIFFIRADVQYVVSQYVYYLYFWCNEDVFVVEIKTEYVL